MVISFDFKNHFIFIFLCLLSTLFLLFFFFKKQKNGFDLPPSLPIIGYLQLLFDASTRISFHKSLQKISSKYGPLLHFRIFNLRIVLASSASVVYEIFKSQDLNVSSRGDAAIDECMLFGSIGYLRAPYGDRWKFTKKLMVTKILGHQALEQSRSFREVELDRFYRKLLDKAMKKQSVKISEETMIFITNTLGKLSMGTTFSNDNNETMKIAELCEEFGALTLKFGVAQVFHKLVEKVGISRLKKDIMDVSNRFSDLLETFLVKHEKKLDEHQGGDEFMDTLLEAHRDENAECKITKDHIKSLYTELFFGVGETTVTTLQWGMAEIINNSKIFARLREEIDSVVGKTRLVQECDLPKLTYLQAVINETLRMYPAGPFLPREFKQGCKIGGFYIHENTMLVINAYAVMRDPNYWEDPNEFKPERFLVFSRSRQEEERREQAMKFLPFGAGRRGCPGYNLGYILVGTAIGVMVQCFDWELKGGEKVNMEEDSGLGLFLGMAQPLECTPLPLDLNPLPTI